MNRSSPESRVCRGWYIRTMNARAGILLIALPAMLPAQATVEHAMGAGLTATSAAPAQKSGHASSAVLSGLGRTLEPVPRFRSAKSTTIKPISARLASARSGTAAPARTARSATVRPAAGSGAPAGELKAGVIFEDPSHIEKGMEYAEIVRRFGPPSLTLTTGPGEETLSYVQRNASVAVTLHDGRAASVLKAGG